jgi:D-sedoheptulose 7-phosphate isomerase
MLTSGNGRNVVAALEKARVMGLTTIAFTGLEGTLPAGTADFLFEVHSTDAARIQEAHMLAGHMLCDWIEQDWMQTEDRVRAIACAAQHLAEAPAASMQLLEVG